MEPVHANSFGRFDSLDFLAAEESNVSEVESRGAVDWRGSCVGEIVLADAWN